MSIATHLKAGLNDVEVVAPDDEPPAYHLKDASNELYDFLAPLFPEVAGIKQVFPNTTLNSRNYPDAVYSIASGPVQKTYKNTVIAYTTLYDVLIREKSQANLMTLVASVENAIISSSGYQRVDSADDFLEEENAYRMGLNIEVSRPVSADLSMIPAKSLIISVGDFSANPTAYDNCMTQRKNMSIEIISTSTTKAGLKAMRAEVEGLLVGWKESDNHTRMQIVSGDQLQADAGLYSAVDVYENTTTIVQN